MTSTAQTTGQAALSGATGANGEVAFSDVMPGSYTFQAVKSGYTPSSAQINAVQGGTISAAITIEQQSGGTGGGGSGGVPGFPIEAMFIGVILIMLWTSLRAKGTAPRLSSLKNR